MGDGVRATLPTAHALLSARPNDPPAPPLSRAMRGCNRNPRRGVLSPPRNELPCPASLQAGAHVVVGVAVAAHCGGGGPRGGGMKPGGGNPGGGAPGGGGMKPGGGGRKPGGGGMKPGGGGPRGGKPGGGGMPRGGANPGGGYPGGGPCPGGGIPGGGPPGKPGGGPPGGGGMLAAGAAGAAAGGASGIGRGAYICGAAETPRPLCIICAELGPPTPRTGPESPCGAFCGAMPIPRPAAWPDPGPPLAPATALRRSSWGGGPSTDMETTVSPRTSTNPSVRFSSRSSAQRARYQSASAPHSASIAKRRSARCQLSA